jgi:hypothetical protein
MRGISPIDIHKVIATQFPFEIPSNQQISIYFYQSIYFGLNTLKNLQSNATPPPKTVSQG